MALTPNPPDTGEPAPGPTPPVAAVEIRPAGDRQQAREAIWRQRRRRYGSGANVALSVVFAAMLGIMLNYAAHRHFPERWNISSTRHYTLSDKTINMLQGVQGRVQIITLFKADMALGDEMRNLLDEYVYAAQRIDGLSITVEVVDPDRDLVRTRTLASDFDVADPNVVIVAFDGRHRVVTENNLVDYERVVDSSKLPAGGPVRVERKKMGFLGELVISSCIQSLAQERRPLVYFLGGHGERNIDDYSNPAGYAGVARLLRRENIEIKPLHLAVAGAVPPDCSTLVIAGVERRLSDAEVARVGEYLERSGRVLLLIDPGVTSGLEPLLETWGVRLARDTVVGLTLTGRELFVRDYGQHPITRPLGGMVTMFYQPRSVEALQDPAATPDSKVDRPHVVNLAVTKDGWAEFNFNQNPAHFDADSDRAAPISVAAAVERGSANGIELELPPTRMVVVGDSDFVSNGALQGGVGANVDFLMNMVNWLVARESLLAIGAKAPIDLRLDMDERQSLTALVLMAGAWPLTVAAFGLAVWFTRRR